MAMRAAEARAVRRIIENRFGAGGLEDMIALATKELEVAQAALEQLRES